MPSLGRVPGALTKVAKAKCQAANQLNETRSQGQDLDQDQDLNLDQDQDLDLDLDLDQVSGPVGGRSG